MIVFSYNETFSNQARFAKAIIIEEILIRSVCVYTFYDRFEEEGQSLRFDIDTLVRWPENVLGGGRFQPKT